MLQLLSAFGGGLIIIPVGLFLASVWSFYRAYRAHNSNSTQQVKGGKTIDNTGNVPYTQIGAFWFGVVLLVCSIGSAIWMYSER